MAGEGESVPCIVRGVVDCRNVGKPDSKQHECAQQRGNRTGYQPLLASK